MRRTPRIGARALGVVGVTLVVWLGAIAAAPQTGAAVPRVATPSAAAAPLTRCFAPTIGPEINERYISYPEGCRGHDEVDFAPISPVAGTASDITWNIVLPKDGTGPGARQVIELGPTIWIGAGAKDAHSLFGQAFVELQLYPDSNLASPYCKSNGDYVPVHSPNTFTACAPVWAVNPSTFRQYAAFNGLIKRSGTSAPLVMHGGDNLLIRFFKGAQAGTPWNLRISNMTTGINSAVLVLTGGVDGPLAPLDGSNTTDNFVQWASMQQAPLSLAWEIGHPDIYRYPLAPLCVPGQFNCWSYNVTDGWKHTQPLQIKSVKFNNNTVSPSSFAVTDTQGGTQEDKVWCGAFNATGSRGFCTFPWYSYNGTTYSMQFGGTYPGTTYVYGKANQFPTKGLCTGGRYCARTLNPRPPLP